MKFSTRSAFTLIELLVVISIIALLSSVVLSSLSSARSKAKDARQASDVKSLLTALQMYALDSGTGEYPVTSGLYNVLLSNRVDTTNTARFDALKTLLSPYINLQESIYSAEGYHYNYLGTHTSAGNPAGTFTLNVYYKKINSFCSAGNGNYAATTTCKSLGFPGI